MSVATAAERPSASADVVLDEDDHAPQPSSAPIQFNYKGREPQAPWRKEAETRIEKLRKAALAIVVNDASGKPVADAEVSVKMKRHAFSWGAATRLPLLLDKPGTNNLGPGLPMPDKAAVGKYQELLVSLFNRSGLITDLRDDWSALNQQDILRAVDWLRSHDMGVRGYALVWPDWGHSKWAAKFKDRDSLNKEIGRRITAKVGALKDKVDEWDVVNEAKNNVTSPNSLFLTAGGVDAMAEWCKIAKQADPKAKLFVTDDGVLDSNTTPTWQNRTGKPTYVWNADVVYDYLQKLASKQAPFDGIGFGGHFKQAAFFSGPEQVFSRLERFAGLGKDLAITEFEVAVPNPADEKQGQLQADYTRDLLMIFFSHPKVVEVTFAAVWEPEARKNTAALFRADATPKANGQAVIDLLRKQWYTVLTGKTDGEGKFGGRGFLGKYEVTVSHGGKTKTVSTELSSEAKPMVVRLD